MDYAKLTNDLREANQIACEAVKDSDDGGTCNLDSCFLQIPRARETKVLDAIKAAGLYCRAKTLWGWIGRGYMIKPTSGGQGDKRTKAVEAMSKELKQRGWDVTTYYKMD
ncbi:hypothetical protein BK133_10915 [Paenibacillus sp. FSL H8-0548]|uniref:hypothetical protein n=1 Tax=Paenibacillus sp. FSL H8-0548 TaxID=1920422 RepID=UPI00096F80E6|nr:hypothetical protein [Paenibacillus sp. FSL H8-0548]OMF35215.1 hypothetical protein BK133_10915 [Paenibacillus sp. FSL H8-0548]